MAADTTAAMAAADKAHKADKCPCMEPDFIPTSRGTCENCGHQEIGVGDHQDAVSRCAQWADGECMRDLCGDCFDASGHGHEEGPDACQCPPIGDSSDCPVHSETTEA